MTNMRRCLIGLLAAVVMSCALAGCQSSAAQYEFDTENMHFVQFETPSAHAPVANIETSIGTIQLLLFPEEAPKACENFIGLVEKGFYNNTEFFNIEQGVACIAGSLTNDGVSPSTIYDDQKFDNEYSSNLWPFSGCVGTISDEEGKSDSRFFLMGDVEVSQDMVDQMTDLNFPQAAIEKFQEVGGMPPFTQRYTIFGQLLSGQELVETIISSEVDGNKYPTGDPFVIESITITTYEEAVKQAGE